jgi:predicted nucleic acid-binding protein
MPFVLDASVAASWMLPDEETPQAMSVRDRVAAEGALAPPHWWYEIRNTMLMSERRNRLSMELIRTTLLRLAQLPIEITGRRDEAAIFAVAQRHLLTFYDAAYLELALGADLPLATLDVALARAATAEGVPLIIPRE